MKAEFASQLDVYVQAVLGKKAQHVVILGVGEMSSLADAFIV